MTTATIRKPEPPTTVEPSSAEFATFVLKQLRCAKLRAEISVNQCEMAITALSGGVITAEQAILILHETGLELIEASS